MHFFVRIWTPFIVQLVVIIVSANILSSTNVETQLGVVFVAIAMTCVFASSFVVFRPFFEGDISETVAWVSIISNVLLVSTALAVIHSKFGIGCASDLINCGKEELTHDLKLSFYFSVVTFTTLGYGDFHPVTNLSRNVAIAQAFFGYLYLGLIVGVAMEWARPSQAKPKG